MGSKAYGQSSETIFFSISLLRAVRKTIKSSPFEPAGDRIGRTRLICLISEMPVMGWNSAYSRQALKEDMRFRSG